MFEEYAADTIFNFEHHYRDEQHYIIAYPAMIFSHHSCEWLKNEPDTSFYGSHQLVYPKTYFILASWTQTRLGCTTFNQEDPDTHSDDVSPESE